MTKKELTKQFKDYPDVLTVKEASVLLGVSTKQVYKLLKQEDIRSIRIGREHKIAKANLIDFIRHGAKLKSSAASSHFVWTVPNPCGMLLCKGKKKPFMTTAKGEKVV